MSTCLHCDQKVFVVSRQLCRSHYRRWQEYGDALAVAPRFAAPVTERLLAKVHQCPLTGCWEWTAYRSQKGYGQTSYLGKNWPAHRLVYALLAGPIPEGMQLDHLCRNRGCVNPAHLEPVTNRVNTARGNAGKHMAAKTHCPAGHPYAGDNLYLHSDGRRSCRTCARERTQARWQSPEYRAQEIDRKRAYRRKDEAA